MPNTLLKQRQTLTRQLYSHSNQETGIVTSQHRIILNEAVDTTEANKRHADVLISLSACTNLQTRFRAMWHLFSVMYHLI